MGQTEYRSGREVSEPLYQGQVRLTVHSTRSQDVWSDTGQVSGRVLADKIATLYRALRAADRSVNGRVRHEYGVSRLSSSSPTIILSERTIPSRNPSMFEPASAIPMFEGCMDAITSGDAIMPVQYDCARQVSRLARGSEKQFGYAELWTRTDMVYRVDGFLVERAEAAISGRARPAALSSEGGATRKWFKGTSRGSFVGQLLEVDLRGSLPQAKLVMPGGQKELDCIFHKEDFEKLRENLRRRVRVEGLARYDGRSGLPRRVDVRRIEPLREHVDFSKWMGAFVPFHRPEWEAQ